MISDFLQLQAERYRGWRADRALSASSRKLDEHSMWRALLRDPWQDLVPAALSGVLVVAGAVVVAWWLA